MRIVKYRPIPGTQSSLELSIRNFLVGNPSRYKVVMDHKNISVTFKFPFPMSSTFAAILEEVRPVGTMFLFDRLGFFECRFKKQRWVEK